ncbi:serine/threonine-protein kinase/endoribonuclease IRE2-like [Mercenaria mercenaria]|uniref:serine/threonine-protein kinase/endoribonuclease IRE2-like n=1 Tax=Mercenaria mercenaria TaxID=6596 RepID=UPI00234E9098|nr:serine/threonine-protein kinase/endoribonuclease IRE2-like [Mercenaria mercenaria]
MGPVASKFRSLYRRLRDRNKHSTDIDCNALNINSSYDVEIGKIICKNSLHPLNGNKTIFAGKFENDNDAAITILRVDFADLKKTKRELKNIAKKLNHKTLPHKLKRVISINQKFLVCSENIVKYFCYEIDNNANQPCIYLAAELCEKNLTDYVQICQNKGNFPKLSTRDVISQMVKGVEYLHEMKVLHRNLKPSKVLIKVHQNKTVVKISGFGVSKCIPDNISSISQSGEYGEPGYIAPEIFQAQQTLVSGKTLKECYKKGSDIFPLGAIIHYVVSAGHHVFSCQTDIQNNKPDFTKFDGDFTLLVLVRDKMLAPKCKDRPSAKDVLRHPALWTSTETLEFFHESSNLLKDTAKLQQCSIETNAANVLRGNSWKQHVSSYVEKHLFPPNIRKNKPGRWHRSTYDETSVLSLLRAVRNLKEHFGELPASVASEFGRHQAGYLHYWTDKFPQLLIHTHDAMKVHSSESRMKRFYK